MKPEIKEKVENCFIYCIKAINEEGTEEEKKYIQDTFKILMQEPYQGIGSGIGHVHANYPFSERTTWKKEIQEYPLRTRTPKEYMLLFFDWMNLNDREMYEYCRQIKSSMEYNFTLQHIIENLAEVGEIEKIKEYIPLFRPDDWNENNNNQYEGYRSILRYYAKQGDSGNFFKTLKFCNSRTLPNEIAAAKALLVQTIYREKGIEGMLKICEHKKIGKKFYNAILWDLHVCQGEYNSLKKLINQCHSIKAWLNEVDCYNETKYLVSAYYFAHKEKKEADDDFEELFKRTLQIGPTIKNGIFNLRDSLLLDLAQTQQHNKERYMRCKKAIKSNTAKRELPH